MTAKEAADKRGNRARSKRAVIALVRQILPAVDPDHNRHSRPDQERPRMAFGTHGEGQLRVVQTEGLAPRVKLQSGSKIERAAAKTIRAAPLDRSFPEGERRRASHNERRLDALAAKQFRRVAFYLRALAEIEADVAQHEHARDARWASRIARTAAVPDRRPSDPDGHQEPIDPVDDEDRIAGKPTPAQRRENRDRVGREPVEERMRQYRQERDYEQGSGAKRQRIRSPRLQPVDEPKNGDDSSREKRPGKNSVHRPTMERDSVDAQDHRSEHVDVGCVGAEQAGGKGKTRTALEPHLADQSAGQSVGDIVQSAAANQSLCGSFSTIQVWPLETSAWRSGVLPLAAARFCSMTAASKVGRGSS